MKSIYALFLLVSIVLCSEKLTFPLKHIPFNFNSFSNIFPYMGEYFLDITLGTPSQSLWAMIDTSTTVFFLI